ncbi:hypothetical protein PM082_015180 [Marasmius tenuissimus]|nr:hypothetical protein PM082_015180 [Marasmius tenuissimus]
MGGAAVVKPLLAAKRVKEEKRKRGDKLDVYVSATLPGTKNVGREQWPPNIIGVVFAHLFSWVKAYDFYRPRQNVGQRLYNA